MKKIFLLSLLFLLFFIANGQLSNPKITFNGIDSMQSGDPRYKFTEKLARALNGSYLPKDTVYTNMYYRVSYDSGFIASIADIRFNNVMLYFTGDSTLYGVELGKLYFAKEYKNKFDSIKNDVQQLKGYLIKQVGDKPKYKKEISFDKYVVERYSWKKKEKRIIIEFRYDVPVSKSLSLVLYVGEIKDE